MGKQPAKYLQMMFFDVTTGNPQFDKQNLRFVMSKVHFLVTFYLISNLITFSIIGKNFTSTHITSCLALDQGILV